MNFLSKVSDICIISILWLLCCLPIVTIGASTTAAYYTMVKVVRRQTGTLSGEFFGAFKRNFKDSFWINLVYVILAVVFLVNIYLVFQSMETSYASFALHFLCFYFMMLLLVLGAGIYTFPVLSRFEMERKKLVKFSIVIMFRNFPVTFLFIALFLITLLVMILFPVGVLFMPGICLYIYSFFMEKVLRKYMTEEMKQNWDAKAEACAEED